MSALTENEIELRDCIYDRLICGADWQELADVLDGHMPYAVAKLAAFAYCNPDFYGVPDADDLIEESNKQVAELIEDYIRTWRPEESEPTDGEMLDFEERQSGYDRGHR